MEELDNHPKDVFDAGGAAASPIKHGRRISFALLMSWLGRAANMVVQMAQLPLFIAYCTKEEVGVWLLMIGSAGFVSLLDFGFRATVCRRVAYAVGQAREALDAQEVSDRTLDAVGQVLGVADRFYSCLGVMAFLVTLAAGFAYVPFLHLDTIAVRALLLPWVIVCLGHGVNVRSGYGIAVLDGIGEIGWANVIQGLCGIFALGATWLVLTMGWGLVGLAAVWMLRGMAVRLTAWLIVYHKRSWLRSTRRGWQGSLFWDMMSPSLKWWVAVTGTFLCTTLGQYVVASVVGAAAVTQFVAALRLLQIPLAVATGILSVGMPLIAQMWANDDLENIQKYVAAGMRMGLAIGVSSLVYLNVYGSEIFRAWLGRSEFPGNAVFLVLSLMTLLHIQHGLLNLVSISAEDMRFYKWTLAAGVLNVAIIFFATGRWGLLGAALSITVSWAATASWYIPYVALRTLHWSFGGYLWRVVRWSGVLGLITVGIGLACKKIGLPWHVGALCLFPSGVAVAYEFHQTMLRRGRHPLGLMETADGVDREC